MKGVSISEFKRPCQQLFDKAFKQFFNAYLPSKAIQIDYVSGTYPKCDIIQHPDKYTLQMEIPGVEKSNIQIQYDITSQILSIIGSKRTTSNNLDDNYIIRQLKKSSFVRRFFISNQKIIGQFNAQFTNGILIINIPKKQNIDQNNKTIKKIQIN